MSDKQLEELATEYAELAKDKNIDAATLMINALQQQDQNRLTPKARRIAYLISLGIPPVGYLFALYYFFFREESDAKATAYWCVALTTISIIGSFIFFSLILSGSGQNLEQIQQIKPADIYELTQ